MERKLRKENDEEIYISDVDLVDDLDECLVDELEEE